MKDQETNHDSSLKGDKKPEIRLKARAVSRGVGFGRVICLHGTNHQFYRIDLTDAEIRPELKRLKKAVETAKLQLEKLAAGRLSDSGPAIFDAQRIILADPSFQSNIENEITERRVNAEWAVKTVTDHYTAKYKSILDEHLRDKYIDIEDVSERILAAIAGRGNTPLTFGKNAVIVAMELKPSSLVELAGNLPKAVITENGGWTSHTFIIAREFDLPAVTGLKKIFRYLQTGDEVIVDGYTGQVIINPEKQTLSHYTTASAGISETVLNERSAIIGNPKTLDGREIAMLANCDVPSAYKWAKQHGAQGIGLYRSEFLFNQRKSFPSENEQVKAYREIAVIAGEGGVKIRTFDLSIAQLIDHNQNREKNPALGLRALRLSFASTPQLKTQIRALLRASYQNKIDIVLPMISGVSEIRAFHAIFESEQAALLKKGTDVGSPGIGAMIELPSAVLMVKELAQETDFLCLGTNDLVQFLLGVDRDNEAVSGWFRTLHPAVIRAVRTVISAGAEAGKPVIVCGEMAGSPYYAPILIGLGATCLSMNVNSIAKVRSIISGIAFEETRALIKNIEYCLTVEHIEESFHEYVLKHWSHLFPAGFLSTLNL
ncbi:MAG: phosphoenolpyruvate--protein phosphotransferase [Pyrinomonadaceae bacterium]